MKNISSCLKAAGSDPSKIVRRRIYTLDMAYLPTIQEVTKRYLSEPWPVSTAVQVSPLSRPQLLSRVIGKESERMCGGDKELIWR